MNTTAARPLIAQGVIGLAVCIGGYAALVLPLREKVAAARAELAEAETQARESKEVEASMASVMDRTANAQKQADAIAAAGELARSQEALYTVVNARAAEVGVRIDEFAPVQVAGSTPAQSGTENLVGRPADSSGCGRCASEACTRRATERTAWAGPLPTGLAVAAICKA